jgi:PIN domain nuclease of toxin-antitoxin system
MGYLLDTHTILWTLDKSENLSVSAENIISNSDTFCCVSIISFFEMAIKQKIGKLQLTKSISEYINEVKRIGISVLPIKYEHLDHYEQLPLIKDHRDPFDRIILATAMFEKFTIISEDRKFEDYNHLVATIW